MTRERTNQPGSSKEQAMDDCHFDRVARSLAGAGETRRGALRLLAGALGLPAAWLGLAEDAEAKKPKRKHKRRLERKRSEAKPQGGLQSEGKRKGKKGKKKPRQPSPLPPGCQQCNDCQMCQDGVCVPDVALEGVRCQGSGATCGYCQFGQCAPSVAQPCEDRVCPRSGQCCPEEKRCPDPESPSGFICVDENACCPDERRCASGCVSRKACCPEDRPQCGPCGEICVDGTWRCSAQKPCAAGVCVAQDECCPEEWECLDGSCVAPDECCPNERRCPNGSCVSPGLCCPGQTGQTPCGDDCCEADETCLENPGGPPWIWRCCPNELNIGGWCCDGARTVCGPSGPDRQCCQEGTECCEGRNCYSPERQDCCNGKGWPKDLGPWAPCGDANCCRGDYEQCCHGFCCPQNAICCSDGHCCPNNRRCCGDTCCLI